MSINYLKKISYSFFSIAIIFCAFFLTPFTKKAEAQLAVPVTEVGSLLENTMLITLTSDDAAWNSAQLAAKEVGTARYNGTVYTGAQVAAQAGTSADSIATKIAKTVIQQFTTSLIKWINSGFNGGPQFITDPATFFKNTADITAGSFIEGSDLSFLCQPFKQAVLLSLNLNYSYAFRDRIGCTLTDVINNIEGATASFEDVGWDGWFQMTQNQQNNVYGASFMAKAELDARIANALGIKRDELQQGSGFLSSRDCLQSDWRTQECVAWGPVKTPGTVIESQLEEALGTNLKQLELAKEFDEILAALMNQLMKQVITQAGGLLGA